jgi:curved DNA-binding protein CbpA
MNLADCYRLLGLRKGASYEEIKASYRRLARKYHPDVNPGNPQQAQEKFIQLTEAYRQLIEKVQPSTNSTNNPADADVPNKRSSARPAAQPARSPAKATSDTTQVKVTRKQPSIQRNPEVSQSDHELKQHSYEQLQRLLRGHRYPRAIALVDGLAQRLPNDLEVRQWQAITYQRFGRYLIENKQSEKARTYLKKALRIDPHNKALWYEVERDFRRIEQMEIY